MPEFSKTITAAGHDAVTLQQIAFKALAQLGWTTIMSADNILVARTPRKWNRWDNEITIETSASQLTVTSKMIHGEAFDVGKRTQKDVATFEAAFETARAAWTGSDEATEQQIARLRDETVVKIKEEIRQAEEVDRVMNLSKGNLVLTYAIMGLNILVFILMAIDGAGLFEPNALVHLKWGSNYAPLTLTGDWWRLLTSTFLHFGILHLAMNLYALYMVGVYLEPMLGKLRFAAAYLAAGILASVASLWWHKDPVNSAGASGAIFGMYGLFLALLTTKLIPHAARQPLLQTTAIFVGYNLFYGMKGGVDNSAHIGGLVTGFIIGQLYIRSLKKERDGATPLHWAAPLVLALSVAGAALYLQQNKMGLSGREELLQELNAMKYTDYDKFNEKLERFDVLNAKGRALMQDTTLNDADMKQKIETEGKANWEEAARVLEGTRDMKISPASHQKAEKLLEYVRLSQEHLDILLQILSTGDIEGLLPRLREIQAKEEAVFQEALKI